MVEPLDANLVNCALSFVELHAARLAADYDLDQAIMPPAVSPRSSLLISLAQDILDTWPTLASAPNARTFLAALLFPKSWTRRP